MRDTIKLPLSAQWLLNYPEGREWVAQLPDRVARSVARFGLENIGAPFEGGRVSYVFPATFGGEEAVVKFQFPQDESAGEAEALAFWAGRGFCRLLASCSVERVVITRKVFPGEKLSVLAEGMSLQARTQVAIDILREILIPVEGSFFDQTWCARRWREDIERDIMASDPRVDPVLTRAALRACDVLMATDSGERVLCHSDLHPGNILRSKSGWVCIDPKPIRGERAFGLIPLVEAYALGHSREALVYRLDTLSAALGCERERVRLWALLSAVHGAVRWPSYHQDRLDRSWWLYSASRLKPRTSVRGYKAGFW